LLRIIAGLEEPKSGSIFFDSQDITLTPPHLRDFGLVFQDYALFPHLNVNENVAFGLKMRRFSQAEIAERVVNSLRQVNLEGFGDRAVTDLSGGEQQRVALARALAIRPRLLMFDEPLGALDRALREDLLHELRSILHRTEIPAIYVTHDQEEAFAIADRILILHDGEIVRAGTAADVWANPGSAFVAGFLGLGNLLEGTYLGNARAKTRLGELAVECDHRHQRGETVHLLARPLPVEGDGNSIEGIVTDVVFQQDRFKVTLDNDIYVYLPRPPGMGDRLTVRLSVECLA
jgi:spermidine/putrescine transport system ATP-binding protein